MLIVVVLAYCPMLRTCLCSGREERVENESRDDAVFERGSRVFSCTSGRILRGLDAFVVYLQHSRLLHKRISKLSASTGSDGSADEATNCVAFGLRLRNSLYFQPCLYQNSGFGNSNGLLIVGPSSR